jgi:Signal transduction histidine kinase
MQKLFKKDKKRGITRRWITATLLFTIVILVAASMVVIVSMRQNYYSTAQSVLEQEVQERVVRIYNYPVNQRYAELRKFVETFSEKDKFEVMLINEDGRVIATSSGYAYSAEEPLDDFYQAMESDSGKGSFIGYSAVTGEHIVSATQVFSTPVGETAAVRYVSSLRNVDRAVMSVVQITVIVSLAIIAFSIFLGMYFIRSIVVPLGELGKTASRIADGDFDVRVENVYNDEIGELCDTINNMAAGLSVSDRVKNEFISSVSHELRTPLTSIKGWGETLQSMGKKDEKVFKKGIDIIINETERLAILVEDLLDFSRLQSGGQMKYTFDVVDIVGEIRDNISIFERRAESLGLKIKCEMPDEAVMISADKNRLRQVFSNLIDNAIKYSQQKDTITIQVTNLPGKVKISVSDMGIGIPEKEISSITDRFYKASNSLTGSGIGLAVVKEIVVMHDGTMKIESALGKGTSVHITLPLLTSQQD